jgi:hypothetical protein
MLIRASFETFLEDSMQKFIRKEGGIIANIAVTDQLSFGFQSMQFSL